MNASSKAVAVEQEIYQPGISVANGADQALALAFDFSQVVSIYILASVAMTLETNDSGTPDDTVSLLAGVARRWTTGEPNNPFSADCTNAFITNASGGAGTLTILIGYLDPTP